MATSSFDKDFTLKTPKAVESFAKIVASPVKSVKIDKTLLTPEKERQGEMKLRKMLSR